MNHSARLFARLAALTAAFGSCVSPLFAQATPAPPTPAAPTAVPNTPTAMPNTPTAVPNTPASPQATPVPEAPPQGPAPSATPLTGIGIAPPEALPAPGAAALPEESPLGEAPLGEAPATGYSLARIRAEAVRVSLAVRAAMLAVAQARARLGQAQAQRRPQLSFNSQASVSNGDVYQPPPSHETFAALQNSVTLPLPSRHRLSALERQAVSQYDAAIAQAATARFDAATQAQTAYFAILKQQALTQNARQNLDQAQAELDAARKRYADGAAPELDALKAQTPVANAQAALLQSQTQEQIAAETLNDLLQRDLDTPVAVADVPAPAPPTTTLGDARRLAAARAADVLAAEASVRAARSALDAARQGHAPDFSLQAIDARSKDVTGFSRLDTLQVSVTLPLTDGGLLHRQIQEAQAALSSAQTTLLQTRQTAALSVSTTYLTAQSALDLVAPTQSAVDIAQTTLTKTRQGYLEGLNPIVDVLNAQLALNQARIAHAQAIYDAASAVAALDLSLGKEQ